MAHTNSTTNYGLPQWIGSDKPTFLGDFNSAFNTIDAQMKSNADTASEAAETASSANATAISANETAVAADEKATLAKNTADAATSAAQSASDLATVAKNTADSAARTAQANNIANLAPAYDETLTYNVGDLVTYVDENNSGKLYKCIVAWNTPGAFNINYWDDVTATAIFENGWTEIAQINCVDRMLKEAMLDVFNLINTKIDLNSPTAHNKFMIVLQSGSSDEPDYIPLKDPIIYTSDVTSQHREFLFSQLFGYWGGSELSGRVSNRLWCFGERTSLCSALTINNVGTNFVKESDDAYRTTTIQQTMAQPGDMINYENMIFRVFIRN